MMSKFFIERPVLANVLALVMMLIGAVALLNLPVAQYPEITPPTVQVTTLYPGASARVVADTVALPIEQQVNGVENMLYMQSMSGDDGTYTLNVTFSIGTNLDVAQTLVQNRVAMALASLPQTVQAQGVVTKKKSMAILQIITLSSSNPRYDSLFLGNYATINLKDELARLPGVGDVNVVGAGQYSMRVWLNPAALQARNLLPKDVVDGIEQQSQQVAAGQVGMPPTPAGQNFQYTINVPGRLSDVDQFLNIIVKSGTDGRITRVRDVGRVELGAQTYSQYLQLDRRPAAGMQIYQLPGANSLQVATEVRAAMAKLSTKFPAGIEYAIPFDTTKFIKASIGEVYSTLLEAAVLVLIVILVFLQDWRATLVPATTVPVTIIGAFAAMAALGFTVNLLTLFGLVLAIGIVVDDAIVVVEGVARHIEHGMSPKDASIKAMADLIGPIIGITLVLMAVFLPAAFLPGITGQMYRQFALVIAATAVISAINAVTLKPTQCALWLRPIQHGTKNFFYRRFDRAYGYIERMYTHLVSIMVERSLVMTFLAIGLMAVAVWGLATLPTSFLPVEDQGYVIVGVQLPDGASLARTRDVTARVENIALKTPGVEHAISIGGSSVLDNSGTLANAGIVYVVLDDWKERGSGQDLRSIVNHLQHQVGAIKGAVAYVLVPPPIQGLGNSGGFQMQVELRDGSFDFAKLQQATQAMVANASTQSEVARLNYSFHATVPQIMFDVDRTKARTLGVGVGDVFDTIQGYFGSRYVNQFNKFGRTFQVFIQGDQPYRLTPEDLARLNTRNARGDMVPLGTLGTIEYRPGPSLVSLYNLYPSAAISGVPAEGFSSGQALNLMEQVAARTLPPGVGYEWTSMAYQEKQVGGQMYFVFLLAMVLVYMALAAQYESWLAPAAVILSVPLALIGTVGVLMVLGASNNVYTQIGIVLLIALASKNSILIVEFPRELRIVEGKPLLEAAVEASRLRFRPIVMTSFAFILGVLPLVTASGAGAASRQSIGIAVFSGMIASTCIAVLFVPSFFVVLQRASEWIAQRKGASRITAGS